MPFLETKRISKIKSENKESWTLSFTETPTTAREELPQMKCLQAIFRERWGGGGVGSLFSAKGAPGYSRRPGNHHQGLVVHLGTAGASRRGQSSAAIFTGLDLA